MKGYFGVIIGNRGVFPGSLAKEGREEIVDILRRQDIKAILVPRGETKYGAIENLKEAKKCAELFRKNQDKIDGILVSLPNFGDERAIADAIKMSGLSVPVLIQAYPDELSKMVLTQYPVDFADSMNCHCERSEAISVRSLGINSTISEAMSRLPRRFAPPLDYKV